MVAEQITRVFPKQTRTEPVAWGATLGWKETDRSWPGERLSERGMEGGWGAGGKLQIRNGRQRDYGN